MIVSDHAWIADLIRTHGEAVRKQVLKILAPGSRNAPRGAKNMKTIVPAIAAVFLCGGSFTAVQAQSHNHVIQTVNEAKWGQAPPMLPAGAQIAVLAGNPTGQGPYTIRLKF